MKTDDNWKSVRLLSKDIDLLLGLPVGVSEDFFKVIENLMIHQFVEQSHSDDMRGKDCEIVIPYVGSLVVSINERNQLTTNFVVRNSFYRKLRRSYLNSTSPLVDQCADILGEDLANRYLNGETLDG